MIDAQTAEPFAWRATMPVGGEGNIALDIGPELMQYHPSDYVPLIGQSLIQIGTQLLNAQFPESEEEPPTPELSDDVS